uniref:Uncharacterized protein n=1 Tax=Anguilla anguilla TaxID=7936 RepID=A0A0E9V7D6_ANGAN
MPASESYVIAGMSDPFPFPRTAQWNLTKIIVNTRCSRRMTPQWHVQSLPQLESEVMKTLNCHNKG